MKNDYYVYVYIDPRNFEEFYYGKGKGSRKNAHLADVSDSDKAKRIAEIKKSGLEPIIRVIAADLNQHDALLVEATLLWKLGKYTTNVASGHYKENFRPHDTYDRELSGFDFQNGIYYFNVGECESRNWDDCLKYGFVAAGGGVSWRDQIAKLQPGDVIVAYLKQYGFVGVGRVKKSAKMIRDVRLSNGKRLLDMELKCQGMADGSDDPDISEYVALVEWIKAVPREEAKWESNSGLFTTPKVRASLDNQPETIKFVEEQLGIDDIRALVI